MSLDGEASGMNTVGKCRARIMNIAVWQWEMGSCCHRGDVVIAEATRSFDDAIPERLNLMGRGTSIGMRVKSFGNTSGRVKDEETASHLGEETSKRLMPKQVDEQAWDNKMWL